MPVSFVTPSTIVAIASPKRSRTSSIDAEVSSTVSCNSAAQIVSVSSRMLAQMRATPTGCTMKSSPDLRRCAAWCSQANTNASSMRARSTAPADSGSCSDRIAKRSPSSRRSSGFSCAREGAAAGVVVAAAAGRSSTSVGGEGLLCSSPVAIHEG